VVIAESGFVAWTLAIPRTAGERGAPSSLGPKVIDARAGQFLTQVPGEAAMTLIPSSRQRMEDLKNDVALAIGEVRHVLPSLTAAARIEDEGLVVTVSGQAVHSSTADEGHNALWGLAEIARRLTPAPTALAKMLDVVSLRFVGDHHGERLGLAYQHPLMGKLLVAPTILRTTDDRVTLSVNMRRPAGRSKEDFEAGLAEALHSMQQGIEPRLEEVGERFVGEPALADVSSPLVPILLDIYRRHTGTEGQPIAIRGGTYARLFRGAVSFGPSFPGRPYLGHAPNEYIELEDLDRLIQMLLEATLRLAPPLVPPTEEAVSSDHPAKEGLLDVPEWRPSGAPR
jgi:acetylornithine deacetylase/succinyl-diaminopimelate desuccinylase-like protein